MEYLTVEKHTITGHYDSVIFPPGVFPVVDFKGKVGDDIRLYDLKNGGRRRRVIGWLGVEE